VVFSQFVTGGGYQSEIVLVDTTESATQPASSSTPPREDATKPLSVNVFDQFFVPVDVFLDGNYCINCVAALPTALAGQFFPTLIPTRISIVTDKLPSLDLCDPAPYGICLVFAGGLPPYIFNPAFALEPGFSLPPGWVLTPAGCIVGQPPPRGTPESIFVFKVSVTDASGATAESGQLSIFWKSCVLFALPAALPPANVGVPYLFAFPPPAGGVPPYHCVKATGSAFPPFGLTITPQCTLSGTPGATTGPVPFTVSAIDAIGNTADANTSIRVNPSLFLLAVGVQGTCTGRVTSANGNSAIACPGLCAENIALNAVNAPVQVTLDATPNAGAIFTGWQGDCQGQGQCVLRMNQNHAVLANFKCSFTLQVAKAGNGSGSVTSNPTGINCGSACTAQFEEGTVVALHASPAQDSVFAGWTGACGGTGDCHLTITANTTVTATFNRTGGETHRLSVTKSGTGVGTVASADTLINCGANCQADYTTGTKVTLTATADANSVFTGWSGACSGTGTCTVTMNSDQVVDAQFMRKVWVAVGKGGTGTGTVTSSPAGIACGTTCSAFFTEGQTVTLHAAADAGSVFAGWSGACTGLGDCVLTALSPPDKAVTATFNLSPPGSYRLTVTKSGTGSGTVNSTPSGISCGATCSATFATGTQVTLTAAADSDSVFDGWSGACSGTGNCVVTMSADKTVTASFTKSSGGIVGNWSGTWQSQAITFCPANSGTWNATFTSAGNGRIAGTWYDSFNKTTQTINGTFDGTTAKWTLGQGEDQVDYTAIFSGNTVHGTTLGPTCSGPTDRISGSFQGTRTGP
jgi:hypothetical protein